MGHRTPLELIQMYWDRVYNDLEVELIREICADPIVRHDLESVTTLSHDEQIERVLRNAPMRPCFTHHVLHAARFLGHAASTRSVRSSRRDRVAAEGGHLLIGHAERIRDFLLCAQSAS